MYFSKLFVCKQGTLSVVFNGENTVKVSNNHNYNDTNTQLDFAIGKTSIDVLEELSRKNGSWVVTHSFSKKIGAKSFWEPLPPTVKEKLETVLNTELAAWLALPEQELESAKAAKTDSQNELNRIDRELEILKNKWAELEKERILAEQHDLYVNQLVITARDNLNKK